MLDQMSEESIQVRARHIRRLVWWVVSLVFAGLLGIAASLWAFLFCHDMNLATLARRTAALSHPAGSSLLAHTEKLGNLFGQGDDCDYFVCDYRAYAGEKSAVVAAYAGVTIPSPAGGEPVPVLLYFNDEKQVRGDSIVDPDANGFNTLFLPPPPVVASSPRWYAVLAVDPSDGNGRLGYDAGIDGRCM